MHFLTDNAIKYSIKHLFMVACPELKKTMSIDIVKGGLSAIVTINSKKIIFNISNDNDVEKLLSGKSILNLIATADDACQIPIVLLKGMPFAEITDNELRVNADIISLSFIMLSRFEESMVIERDAFDGFEFKNSIASKYNFIDFPIVDEYALILRKYLVSFNLCSKFETNKCIIIPTHDIDQVLRFDGLIQSIRTIFGDMILHKKTGVAFASARQYINSINNPIHDPYINSIYKLIDISKEFNLRSEFYFMGANQSRYNNGYEINTPIIRAIIERIFKNQMIVGLHGGYESFNDSLILKREKEKVECATDCEIRMGRQHYLRFNIKTTFKTLESVGIKYDSTLGYNEQEGFRCGTCYEYQPFDFANDCAMKIIERPLIVMDNTLWAFKKYSKSEAYNKVMQLYLRCLAVGGNFIISWHNSYVNRKTDWFEEVYIKFLKASMLAKALVL